MRGMRSYGASDCSWLFVGCLGRVRQGRGIDNLWGSIVRCRFICWVELLWFTQGSWALCGPQLGKIRGPSPTAEMNKLGKRPELGTLCEWGTETGRRRSDFGPMWQSFSFTEGPGVGLAPRTQAKSQLSWLDASSHAPEDECGYRDINILSREKMGREKSLAVTKSLQSRWASLALKWSLGLRLTGSKRAGGEGGVWCAAGRWGKGQGRTRGRMTSELGRDPSGGRDGCSSFSSLHPASPPWGSCPSLASQQIFTLDPGRRTSEHCKASRCGTGWDLNLKTDWSETLTFPWEILSQLAAFIIT